MSGLTVAFSTGAAHRLQKGAIVQDSTAFHISISLNSPVSVSTQISTLRRLLLGGGGGELAAQFKKVADGLLVLVVDVESADVMASLIGLKAEIEASTGKALKMTFTGASEAHLLAAEISEASIGVIVTPARPFPASWERRRV